MVRKITIFRILPAWRSAAALGICLSFVLWIAACSAPVVESPEKPAGESPSSPIEKTTIEGKESESQVSLELHKTIERFVVGNIRAVQKLGWKNLDSFADTRQWLELHAKRLPSREKEGYQQLIKTPEGQKSLKEKLHRRAMRMFKRLEWPMKVATIEARPDQTYAVELLSKEKPVPHKIIVRRFNNSWRLVNIEYRMAR